MQIYHKVVTYNFQNTILKYVFFYQKEFGTFYYLKLNPKYYS